MSLERINIKCQKFTGDLNLHEANEINFFAVPQTLIAISDEIELKDYLIDIDTLNFRFDNSGEKSNSDSSIGGGANELFFETSDLNMKLSGMLNNGYLQDFFDIILEPSTINIATKYKVSILLDNQVIHTGFVNQNSVEEVFNDSDSNRTISLQVLGMEKEFATYYQNKPLPPPNFTGGSISANGVSFTRFNNGLHYDKLDFIVSQVFNSYVELESTLTNYYVCGNPNFIRINNSSKLFFIKSAYERSYTSGATSWEWFKFLCNSMGWIFLVDATTSNPTLKLFNRANYSAQLLQIDFEDVISFKITKEKENVTFDNILIIDGIMKGGDGAFFGDPQLKGNRIILLSKNESLVETNHFSDVNVGIFQYQLMVSDGHKFSRYDGGDEKTFNIKVFEFHESPIPVVSGSFTSSVRKLNKRNLLIIDAGSDDKIARVDLSNTVVTGWEEGEGFNDPDLIFSGVYGNSIIKSDTNNLSGNVETYQDYVRTEQFANNFFKYLNSNDVTKIEVEINRLIQHPLYTIQFTNNSSFPFEDGNLYSIQKMEINLMDETTKFELLKKRTNEVFN